MIWSIFGYLACSVLLSLGIAAAHPMDEERIKDLGRAYGRLLTQEATLESISTRFPDLATDLADTKLVVEKSIAGEGSKGLVQVLSKLKGAEWEAYQQDMKMKAVAGMEKEPLGPDEAVGFLAEVRKKHAKGMHPDLPVLLSAVPRFIEKPELEYQDNKYVIPVATRAMPKIAKGLDIGFLMPLSWDFRASSIEGSILAGVRTGPGAEPMMIQMEVRELPAEAGELKTTEEQLEVTKTELTKALQSEPLMTLIDQSNVELGGRKHLLYVVDMKIGDTPIVRNGILRMNIFVTPIQGKILSTSFAFTAYDGSPSTHVELQEHYRPLYTRFMESIVEPPK